MLSRRSAGRGYVMLESLVSVLIVSIGFIGLAGMQVQGLKAANESLFRSNAVELSYEMADRVRANWPGAQAGNYNALTGPVSNPGCIAVNCTPSQMALSDYADWSAAVAGTLPRGTGVVCIDSTPDDGTSSAVACDGVGNVLAVKIWWTEGAAEHAFALNIRP